MQKTYKIFEGEQLKIAEKIQQRRLQILVHSCIYYEMDQNIISDKKWDEWARELKKLQEDYPEISRQVDWYAAFADWDASTGAFLPLKDKWVVKKAKWLLNPEIKKLEKSNKPAVDKKTGSMKLF